MGEAATDAPRENAPVWRHATGALTLDRPRILGIVNVTPDSFSDGGRLRTLDDARRHVERLMAEGADVIDIGGESTRPQGARTVDAEEELRRVVPLVQAVRRDHPAVPISVDTTKAAVAHASLEAGASIVNDVSAFRLDDAMARRVRGRGRGGCPDALAWRRCHHGDVRPRHVRRRSRG